MHLAQTWLWPNTCPWNPRAIDSALQNYHKVTLINVSKPVQSMAIEELERSHNIQVLAAFRRESTTTPEWECLKGNVIGKNLTFENKKFKKLTLDKNTPVTTEKKHDQFPSLSQGNIATLWDSYSGLYANLTQVCQKEICAEMWILTKKLNKL